VDTLKNIIDFNSRWMYFVSKITHLRISKNNHPICLSKLSTCATIEKIKSKPSLGHIEHNKSLCFNSKIVQLSYCASHYEEFTNEKQSSHIFV
jgi:hypothetical protein